jgi:hypothetical protein
VQTIVSQHVLKVTSLGAHAGSSGAADAAAVGAGEQASNGGMKPWDVLKPHVLWPHIDALRAHSSVGFISLAEKFSTEEVALQSCLGRFAHCAIPGLPAVLYHHGVNVQDPGELRALLQRVLGFGETWLALVT